MNTISSTINKALPSYTAVGGAARGGATGLSAVILSQGSRRSREAFFEDLQKSGFDYVVSIEGVQKRFDVESLSGNFPFVRFILLSEEISPGEAINLAALELSSPLFFVLWDDLHLIRGGNAERMAERLLAAQDGQGGGLEESGKTFKRLCTVPVIQNARVEILATLSAPALQKKRIRTIPFAPFREGLPTLYPFEGIGIYDRESFVRLGGFDGNIRNFHWQLLDFGFRSWLWGEEIASTEMIRLSYEGFIPVADNTLDGDYRRFYLKNLAPVFRRDHADIPLRAFPGYCRLSGGDLFSAWRSFAAARAWVNENRYRFRNSIAGINALWDGLGEGSPALNP